MKSYCERPECGRAFGLVRKYANRWKGMRWQSVHYCSSKCRDLHQAEINAQAVKKKDWFKFLSQ
jgi:hypothetical protein